MYSLPVYLINHHFTIICRLFTTDYIHKDCNPQRLWYVIIQEAETARLSSGWGVAGDGCCHGSQVSSQRRFFVVKGQNMNTHKFTYSFTDFPNLRSCSCKFCTSEKNCFPRFCNCHDALPRGSISTCSDRGLQHAVPVRPIQVATSKIGKRPVSASPLVSCMPRPCGPKGTDAQFS